MRRKKEIFSGKKGDVLKGKGEATTRGKGFHTRKTRPSEKKKERYSCRKRREKFWFPGELTSYEKKRNGTTRFAFKDEKARGGRQGGCVRKEMAGHRLGEHRVLHLKIGKRDFPEKRIQKGERGVTGRRGCGTCR